MSTIPILVLADPADAHLKMLDELRSGANVTVGTSLRALAEGTASARVILNWSAPPKLLLEVFKNCPNVQWIHTRSAGIEKVLFPEIVNGSVTLTNGTGAFSSSLGEFAVAAILYFAKDLKRMIRNQAAGVWQPFDVMPVANHFVGIIGYGDVGRAVASRARSLGMRVLAVKRHVPSSYSDDPFVEQIYSPAHRNEMLSRCDYIVITAPLTSETRSMIGEAEFASMKPNAVIINIGRGPIIDEQALITALMHDQIRGAALDVFDQEPLPDGHPFYKLENVLLSAHCADNTPDWLDQAMELFIDQFKRFRAGEPFINVVDKKLGY
jgi:phosphoglycerate dehydrogenase-like enzyme